MHFQAESFLPFLYSGGLCSTCSSTSLAGWWHKRLHCLLPAVVLAPQFKGEIEQSDLIISSLPVSHPSVLYEY